MGCKETADELNRYFASVFTVQDTSGIPELQESQRLEDEIAEHLEVRVEIFRCSVGTTTINHLDKETEGIVAKFVDDTEIDRGTGSVEEMGRLQKDLDRLGEWAKKGQMEYNLEKYEVIHYGVWKGFTRMIPGMKGLSYEEWLRTLGLSMMEFGRLFENYRILRGLDRAGVEKMFPLPMAWCVKANGLKGFDVHSSAFVNIMVVLNPLLCFIAVALKNHSCNKIADGSGNHGNRKGLGLADGVLPEGELLLQ
eukprot:g37704.t1